jgi:hypothetical protein
MHPCGYSSTTAIALLWLAILLVPRTPEALSRRVLADLMQEQLPRVLLWPQLHTAQVFLSLTPSKCFPRSALNLYTLNTFVLFCVV